MSQDPDRVTVDGIRAVAKRLESIVHRTPLVASEYLSRRVGARVLLKLENLQKTGSFKPRGAFAFMLDLDDEARARGVVTISAGNHAQAVAYAATRLGITATVVMPASASPFKVEATRGYGAEVVLHGDVKQAFARMEEIRQGRGLTLVHPFDSVEAVTGQGTVGLEIIDDCPDVDLVVCGIGGGALAAGIATAVTSLRPQARVVGVEPVGAAAMTASLEAGATVRLDEIDTIADGLAPPFVGELPFAIARRRLESVVRVSDDVIVDGMRVLFERAKVVAEPSGAAAIGAILAGAVPVPPGGVVVAVVSGGNVAFDSPSARFV